MSASQVGQEINSRCRIPKHMSNQNMRRGYQSTYPMGKSPTNNHTKNYTPPDQLASTHEVQQPTEPNIVISKEERQNNEPELDLDEFNCDFFLLNQLQVEVDIRGIIEILATNNSNLNAYSSLI